MPSSKLTVFLVSSTCLTMSGEPPKIENLHRNSTMVVAGEYYFGDGNGVNCSLTVKPESRFSLTWRGCLGVYYQNESQASGSSNLN
jgi:hypothetical protein